MYVMEWEKYETWQMSTHTKTDSHKINIRLILEVLSLIDMAGL